MEGSVGEAEDNYCRRQGPGGSERHIKPYSPKIEFAKGVKELEKQINKGREKKLILSSFILSYTKESELLWRSIPERNWFKEHNVFFMDAGGPVYLAEMFRRIMG